MSVLSRRRTVPTQRASDPREDLDAPLRPARARVAAPPPAPSRRRGALIISAGVLLMGAGTAVVYVVADGGAPEPAAPAAPAAGFNSGTEAQRDAAMARRGPAAVTDGTRTTEALRDAATAARGGTAPGTGTGTQSGTGLIP